MMKKVNVQGLNKGLKKHPILTRILVPFYLLVYPFIYTALVVWEHRGEMFRELTFGVQVIFLPWDDER